MCITQTQEMFFSCSHDVLNGEQVGGVALHVVPAEALPCITCDFEGYPGDYHSHGWQGKKTWERDTWEVFVGQACIAWSRPYPTCEGPGECGHLGETTSRWQFYTRKGESASLVIGSPSLLNIWRGSTRTRELREGSVGSLPRYMQP